MENQMYEELVQGLLKILPQQTVQIVLYGSTARGTADETSDIDIALFLNTPLTRQQEDQLNDLVTELNLQYDRVFSVIDIDEQTFIKWENASPFYQNVSKEGIVLWKAA